MALDRSNFSNLNASELLEQILAAGKGLVKEGKTQAQSVSRDLKNVSKDLQSVSGDLTAQGKALAAKGENYLVDKLNIEDTAASRAALRKGVGAGAAAGALALLLSSRSGRKMMTLGGLGALGVIAYKAHKSGKMPRSKDDVIGLLTGPSADSRAEILLRAMISAAKADAQIHEDELALIRGYDNASVEALQAVMDQPADPAAIAAMADGPQSAAEIYAVSCRVANGLNPRERDYLDALAMGLKLEPELAARIETDVRTG